MKLPGNDLHDFQILRHMHVPRRQIERALSRLNVAQIDLSAHIAGLQAMNHALRPAHRTCASRKTGGIDLQVVGKIAELDRNLHLDFRDRIARHSQPQANGQQQTKSA